MKDELLRLKEDLARDLSAIKDAVLFEDVRVKFFGRKGALSSVIKRLKDLSENERKEIGAFANNIKNEMEEMFEKAQTAFLGGGESLNMDLTLPASMPQAGHLHLATQAIQDISEIFENIGFTRARHPEIDWDYYAFESLNMPKAHPARDEWETFFVDAPVGAKGKQVLTPHTTNSDVREMEKGILPIRRIFIGKTYRRQIDITHAPMFHQFEGLVIDRGLSLRHLFGVFDYFVKQYFGPERKVRLRPFHFRFTEPSVEIDISCDACNAEGSKDGAVCRLCKSGWLELGGAGMLHPNVLRAGGVDPDKYSGVAFGWGLERTAMMREGLSVKDIRVLYKNDLRFNTQF
ncbi:MAG: hypothetical protein ACD_76C00042G0003 [uncultured bacterium]|nr:MAG: hypothetical protein ACD_76C00042G0003 [uncultured bacterium]HBD05456.1 phenylalanine--tRNA ligase subunit alpha [Candidatus Uhrbacteria bacterium]